MKRICIGLVFALFFFSAASAVRAQTQLDAFAGNWMLDKQKTNTSKDFPQKLKNYKMAVAEQENKIRVRSQVEGNVIIESAGRGAMTPVTESNSMSGQRQAASAPTDSTTGQVAGKVNYGGTMAVYFTSNDATYNLDGEEVKVETQQGLVRVKAKMDKSGKALQFTTIRRMKMPNGEMEVTTREVWKLSEDGKTLKLQRTVETPTARDEIIMMLSKVTS